MSVTFSLGAVLEWWVFLVGWMGWRGTTSIAVVIPVEERAPFEREWLALLDLRQCLDIFEVWVYWMNDLCFRIERTNKHQSKGNKKTYRCQRWNQAAYYCSLSCRTLDGHHPGRTERGTSCQRWWSSMEAICSYPVRISSQGQLLMADQHQRKSKANQTHYQQAEALRLAELA